MTELLADYPQLRFEFDITQELAARAIFTQYRESDLEFLTRLLASEGLNWRFEHEQAGDDDGGDGQAKHRLVIFDSKAKAPATPGGGAIRFHGVRATDADDAVDEFRARRQGKHGGAVNGQDAVKAKCGARELDVAKPVEKFGAPVVLMEAPANINWATPALRLLVRGILRSRAGNICLTAKLRRQPSGNRCRTHG